MKVGLLEAVGTAISAAVAFAVAVGGAVKYFLLRPFRERLDEVEEKANRADDRSESNEYILLGDDDDPNYSGVAQDVNEIKDMVEEIKDNQD